MTKRELVKNLRESIRDYPAEDMVYAVNVIFDAMTQALKRNERIDVRGFGSFSVRQRQARKARNPRNGSSVALDARRAPFFKTGKELQERINSHK